MIKGLLDSTEDKTIRFLTCLDCGFQIMSSATAMKQYGLMLSLLLSAFTGLGAKVKRKGVLFPTQQQLSEAAPVLTGKGNGRHTGTLKC